MISICIPAYQTDPNDLINQLMEQANALSIDYEILVFDDHSPQPIVVHHEQASLIRSDENLGSIAARMELATTARYDQSD